MHTFTLTLHYTLTYTFYRLVQIIYLCKRIEVGLLVIMTGYLIASFLCSQMNLANRTIHMRDALSH